MSSGEVLETARYDLKVLLPEVPDERDACVDRLAAGLKLQKGIDEAHVVTEDATAELCVHYDPELITLPTLGRIVERAGGALSERYRHVRWPVAGIDCSDCAFSLEHILGREDGVEAVSVNPASEKVFIEYDSEATDEKHLRKRISQIGYRVALEEEPGFLRRQPELILAVLSGVFLAAGFLAELFSALPRGVVLGLYGAAYLSGGYHAARHGIAAALRMRFDIDFLMVVAAIGAASLGAYAEGGLLLFLFSLGHALEHLAMDRARRQISALGELTPKTARAVLDGVEREIPVEELEREMTVVVRAGERLPVDGEIEEGSGSIDESSVTGESVPVDKGPGDAVFAGTVNGSSALRVRTTKLAGDSTIARVIELVQEAESQQAPSQRFAERFTRIFVPVVLVVVVLTIAVPPLTGLLPFSEAFLRAMTILVGASPCALAIATPAAVLSGIARAARAGILLKGGMHLENLGTLSAVAFDKTGTVTTGEFEVTDVWTPEDAGAAPAGPQTAPARSDSPGADADAPRGEADTSRAGADAPRRNAASPRGGAGEESLLSVAAALEAGSTHPLAQAVQKFAARRGTAVPAAEGVETVGGRGVTGTVDGREVRVGNRTLFADRSLPDAVTQGLDRFEGEGKTCMIVEVDGSIRGMLALRDQGREGAKAVVAELRRLGIRRTVLITGDNESVARSVAAEAGIDEYRAGLLPEEKVTAIRDLKERYGSVAMLGDGVNDAPALAGATVGIAMGAGGTDVALETADVALMADDIRKMRFAVELSRRARRTIVQNLAIALGVMAVLVVTALTGIATIGPAIIAHEGSTLLVVANALRLLGVREGSVESG